jgi:N-acetylmuramoyl-L-alanine amidase
MLNKKTYFIGLFIYFIIILWWPTPSSAESAKALYFKAEASYHELQKKPTKQKYRDNWLACIKKFQAVYRYDPTDPWATAGLYMTATLYQELYRFSGHPADRQEALDNFEHLIKRYPKSRYRQRASRAIQNLSQKDLPKEKSAASKAKKARSSPQTDDSAKDRFHRAEACSNKLRKNPEKQKYRDNWLTCIKKFQAVYDHDPYGPWAAAGLYRAGLLYQKLYQRSYKPSDHDEALKHFNLIIKRFAKSSYYSKATAAIGSFSNNSSQSVAQVDENKSKTKKNRSDKKIIQPPSKTKAVMIGLRFWSNPNYTRIVIDADRETSFTHNLLKRDPSNKKPQRLYVDLQNCKLDKNIKKIIPIDDDLLKNARAGQFTPTSVRVVADIKSFKTYKVFSLRDPFRIVMDMWGGEDGTASVSSKKSDSKPKKKNSKLSSGALAKQLALGVRRIVIDPGHGGRDYGAPGYRKGVHEKDVALKIARRLAKKIRQQLNCEVFMTRNSDRYLTLEERTAIANTKNADLFISIHTNANKDRRLYGISSYFLNLATDDESIRVAALENATSTKNISDLQTILNDLMQNAKINESSRLAGYIQQSMYKHLKRKGYSRIKDQGVKQAPFYVLLGAQMPAVLIEASFISNRRECNRLINPKYQERLSEAIVIGIQKYIKETHPTAFLKGRRQAGTKG